MIIMKTIKKLNLKQISKYFILTILLINLTLISSCSKDEKEEKNINIDLKVDSYELIKVYTYGTGGQVRIKGLLKNVGDDYISDEGQQAFYLSFRNLGATGLGDTFAQMDFTTINSGETIGFSTTFFWNANVEFPSEVILYIGYDEDIKTDGNLNNDDNNPENDIIIISGYDIHDLFH